MSLVLTELKGPVGLLTLNHPERRNCLSQAMLGAIGHGLQELLDRRARAIVIRAAPGSRVWSSGFDIDDYPVPGQDVLTPDDDLGVALKAIQHCPVPVIAMIEGSVWGGACDLAVTCDLAIAVPETTFAITPAKLGVPYTTGGLMRFMAAMPVHLVKELFFTAQPIGAARAREVGILNHVVAAGDLEAFTLDLAGRIAENSPLALSVLKEQLRVLGNSYAMSPETQERIQGLRRMVFESPDFAEGKRAFREKRKHVFAHKKAIQRHHHPSPDK